MSGLAAALVLSSACFSSGTSDLVEARALTGGALRRPAIEAERRASLEQKLADAREAWRAEPEAESSFIWVGRRLAYLGRYREAIDWYTRGLEAHPDSFRLLRHRGHRYISVRELDAAIADLSRAASLIEGVPDEVEEDGAPQPLRSTAFDESLQHLLSLGTRAVLVGAL